MIDFHSPLSHDFQRLLTWRDESILSLYMPARDGSRYAAENEAVFRQLISHASVMLGRGGWREPMILSFLAPLMVKFDLNYWNRHAEPGFALFYGSRWRLREFWTLDEPPPRTVTVNGHAHVKPLLKCWFRDMPYYLLHLTSERPRLFLGNSVALEEFDDPDIRTCFRRPVPELSMAGDGALPKAVSRGCYTEFCSSVMAPLVRRFESDPYPLIVCGEKEAVDLFLKYNTYGHLLGCRVESEPERLATEDLRAGAVEVIRDTRRRATLRNLGHCAGADSRNRLVDDLETTVRQAVKGGVRKLFIACDREVWGFFDPVSGNVDRKNFPGLGREDLLDTCARLVLLNGGDVFSVDAKTLKAYTGGKQVSALIH